MDYAGRFQREVIAFEAAARQAAGRLEVQGDASLLSGYFDLVPPL